MASMFAVRILMSMLDRPIGRPTEGELAAIRPGAWATWAKAGSAQAARQAKERTDATSPFPGRPAHQPLPRSIALRLRP